MVATLLANAILTPEGKPEAEADIEPVQIGVAVYTISVIAVVPVTVCEVRTSCKCYCKFFTP